MPIAFSAAPDVPADAEVLGVPVFAGQVTNVQLGQVADLAESYGGDVRITRQQNFIMANVPHARVDDISASLTEMRGIHWRP